MRQEEKASQGQREQRECEKGGGYGGSPRQIWHGLAGPVKNFGLYPMGSEKSSKEILLFITKQML